MKIDLADIYVDADAWNREWHDKRNAAVAALVDDGISGRIWKQKGDLDREDQNDEQMRWLFRTLYKPESERSSSERKESPDARLYEAVTHCMTAARDDERKRLSKVIGASIKALLGDEFTSVMFDIAVENDINIGHD